MPDLTVTIPHQLGRPEAKRRIQDQLAQVKQQAGSYGKLDETWQGDRMDFTVSVMGQSFTGRLQVEDQQVRLEVALPAMLAMLAGSVRQRIEEQGRKLLSGPKPS
jgi:putative polyhydroxyalkanoate system protein